MTTGVILDQFAYNFVDGNETPDQAALRGTKDKGLKIVKDLTTGDVFVGHTLQEKPNLSAYKKPTQGGDDFLYNNMAALSGTLLDPNATEIFTVSKQELLAVGQVVYTPHDLNKNARKILEQRNAL